MINYNDEKCSMPQDRLVRYAYRELPFFAKRKMAWHIKKCTDCNTRVHEHRLVRNTLRKNTKQTLPPEAIEQVNHRLNRRSTPPIPWRLVIGTAVIIAIVTGWWVIEYPGAVNQRQYSSTEITHTKNQVEKALGILGMVMENTLQSAKNDVLTKELATPMEKNVEKALEPLIDGGSS